MHARRLVWIVALGLCASAGTRAAETVREGAIWTGPVDAMPTLPSVDERLAEIRRRVQEAVVYPKVARRRGFEGLARVQFEIGGDGHARDVAVVASSGFSSLDGAAERGVLDAGILPRVVGRLQIPVRFDLAQ